MTQIERSNRRQQIIFDCKNNVGIEELVLKYGLGAGYIIRILRDANVFCTGVQSITTKTYAILAELLNTSNSIVRIANNFKLSRQRIYSIYSEAKQCGIKFPHRGE